MDYASLKQLLDEKGVKLVAVSKTHPPSRIMDLYEQGQRLFGENRVQELVPKYRQLPSDIQWHLIGHLQTNKVKYVVPFVHLIQSVDRFKLLREIEKQAKKVGRTIDCLLQFHIAREETKFGFHEEEAMEMLESEAFRALRHVCLCGVMGMATFTDDREQVRREFRALRRLFERLKAAYFADQPCFCEVSMGMSGDWQIAVDEGSTMVRLGSLLFGPRR